MDNPTLHNIENRLTELRAKLASRKGKIAYRDNVPYLEAEIARLEGTRNMILEAGEKR